MLISSNKKQIQGSPPQSFTNAMIAKLHKNTVRPVLKKHSLFKLQRH